MKDRLNLWLSQSARLPGVLACGLHYPDHSSFTQQWADGFEPGPVEKSLACMTDVCRLLRVHGISGRWLRWRYGKGLVYVAQRADGTALGVITGTELSPRDATQVTALLEEFLDKDSAEVTPPPT